MFSVCALIVTRNRTDWLKRCVRSLRRAAELEPSVSLRILVCLNGSDPRTLLTLEQLKSEPGCAGQFEFLHIETALSPAQARNKLLSRVSEEWTYFVDDDAFVPEEHFRRFARAIECHSSADVIGGPNLLPHGSGEIERATDVVLTSRTGTWSSSARYRRSGEEARECSELLLILCNLFVRTSHLKTQAFPESFVCAEENALLYELSRCGCRLMYCPELFNWHERRPSLRQLFEQVFKYGHGRGQFLLKYPSGLRLAHLLPGAALVFTVYSMAAIFSAGRVPAAWSALVAIYLAACMISVVMSRSVNRPSPPWWSVVLFPVVHSGYGMGLVYGFVSHINSRAKRGN